MINPSVQEKVDKTMKNLNPYNVTAEPWANKIEEERSTGQGRGRAMRSG